MLAGNPFPIVQAQIRVAVVEALLEGLNADSYTAKGDSPIAHIWTALHFGDYMAYYLAMAYGVDPTPVEALVSFKQVLKQKN